MPHKRTSGTGPLTFSNMGFPIERPRSPRMRKCGDCGAIAGERCQYKRETKASKDTETSVRWIPMKTYHVGR